MKHNIRDLSFEELQALVATIGLEPYRAQQIFQWVHQKFATGFQQMSNISRQARERLEKVACISWVPPEKIFRSADASKKFIFRTVDGHGYETVLIPEKNHKTLCVSTQIGCPIGCRFCFSGQNGLIRNLSVSEIINQIGTVMKTEKLTGKLPNIVFMGMGEPLSNYSNTVKSIRCLMHPWGFNFSHRKITVSTAGLIPQIRQLSRELPVNLAISLNAPNNSMRNALMPINKKFPINDLLECAKTYPISPRKRITFEYILIKDMNDSPEHAFELGKLLKGIPCKINLIPFNEHTAISLKRPSEKTVLEFQRILHALLFTAPIRRSKGSDIAAACGQLGNSSRTG